MLRICSSLLVAASVAASAHAQRGDRRNETQAARIPAERIPPSPPLAPPDALKSFTVAPGFRIETVAHEPMVQVPVALQFDPEGRLWVLEMRGYMPHADGVGEDKPVGRISILEDTNHDGRADRSTVFLDGLFMPRSFLLVRDGVLVAEPPSLWFYPIREQSAGERVLVEADYAKEADARRGRRANPEHAANSLTLALDNWIYSLYHTWRYRYENGQWLRKPNPKRTQWGMSQDNYGRLFYTSNSDHLRGDLVPSHYLVRHGINTRMPGVNVQIARDQSVWPGRVNPGVNRGYQTGTLRDDGTLVKFTAACGTSIYRGDQFPPEFAGNAFTPEPAANLIRRSIVTEENGMVTARNAYHNSEFLISTDELFRPVNTCTGPDGALYIADMYHGIIQHRNFLTTYLRQQAESRGLDKVTDYGRIYRVVHVSQQPSRKPQLSNASSAELARALAHPNGWWRDTAQRLLVERADSSVLPALQSTATTDADHLARLHALWTLEGMNRISEAIVTKSLEDPHPKVRAAAVRLSERFLDRSENHLRDRVLKLAADPATEVRVQLALTLGETPPAEASRSVLTTLSQDTSPLVRDTAKFALSPVETKEAAPAAKKVGALSAEDQKRFEAGKEMYDATCVACHQPHGLGLEGLAPPLVGSEWIASEEQLVRMVIHGVRGPIQVKGQTYEADMPALGVLEDQQIADVLTYVRREWGHDFPPVSATTVKKIRDETREREDAWTAEELSKFK